MQRINKIVKIEIKMVNAIPVIYSTINIAETYKKWKARFLKDTTKIGNDKKRPQSTERTVLTQINTLSI